MDRAYSNNIYREMTIDDLRREYEKTVLEANDYKDLVYHELVKRENKGVDHLIKKYDKKTFTIKEMLNKWLILAGIMEVEDVTDAFHKLFKIRKSDPSHRLKTLYSYDIKDNNIFKKT